MAFIGIDLGTSFIKGAVLEVDTAEIQCVRRIPFPIPVPPENPLICEYDPALIVATVQSFLEELATCTDSLEGVVMSSQMHSLVLLDRQFNPVSNCITWKDRRGLLPLAAGQRSCFEELLDRVTPEQLTVLGHELKVDRPVTTLFTLSRSRGLPTGATPASLSDLIYRSLCDSRPTVELTMAAGYGILNLTTLDWDRGVLRALGLDHLEWPAVQPLGSLVGYALLRGKRIPCYVAVGDFQTALLGALLKNDELSLNVSTGAQVSRISARFQPGEYQTRPFFDHAFVNTFSDLPGGRSLNAIVSLVTELAPPNAPQFAWDYIDQAVGATGVPSTPAQVLFVKPEKGNSGGFVAQFTDENCSIGTLFQAAFRNMAEQAYAGALGLWPERGWTSLVLSGGLALRSRAFRDIVAEVFGGPCRLSPNREDTLAGLLILAQACSERISS